MSQERFPQQTFYAKDGSWTTKEKMAWLYQGFWKEPLEGLICPSEI